LEIYAVQYLPMSRPKAITHTWTASRQHSPSTLKSLPKQS